VSAKNSGKNLLVVAHPDDETLFFAGLVLSTTGWDIACATDGNADGQGSERASNFVKACRALKIRKIHQLELPDIYDQRLHIDELTEKLLKLGPFKKVFTHGPLGEYGHRHHQDVSYAVHKAYQKTPVYSVAYNAFPSHKVHLTPKQFDTKTKILWDIYGQETKRLIHFLPAHSYESFVRVDLREVELIYRHLTEDSALDPRVVKVYRWLIPYLNGGGGRLSHRPF
jgi:LmbE family N-acetylglucosaminyl deacetylase